MSKKKREADKSMDKFFNKFIEKQKAAGASLAELAVQGEDLIKQLMKRFYESALQLRDGRSSWVSKAGMIPWRKKELHF